MFQATVRTEAQKNEEYIEALMDEIGTLSQDNFILAQQVESQRSVLQSIESEFTEMEDVLDLLDQDFESLRQGVDEEFTFTEGSFDDSDDNTIDFLILGTNGAHTDTLIIASVNEEEEKISVFSVPRDLYVNGRRINAYFTYYGVDQLERMLEDVVGLEIDHYAQVDLDGFEQVVNIIGGIDVYVEEAIYDGLYPSGNGGYHPYSIEVGQYHFDGEEALKYARSRKSTSDFHRAARQQDILEAIRKKVIQMDAVMNTKELAQLFQAFLSHVETDMSLLDIVAAYNDYKDYEINSGLVISTDNYLRSMINQSGAYILLPSSGNYDQIKAAIRDLVE